MENIKKNGLTRKERKMLRRLQQKQKKAIKNHKKKVREDVDHLVAKAMGGSEHTTNKLYGDAQKHCSKHIIYGIKLFHDQLIQVIDNNYQSLHKETRDVFVYSIINILENFMNEQKLYDRRCFKNHTPPKSTGLNEL